MFSSTKCGRTSRESNKQLDAARGLKVEARYAGIKEQLSLVPYSAGERVIGSEERDSHSYSGGWSISVATLDLRQSSTTSRWYVLAQ